MFLSILFSNICLTFLKKDGIMTLKRMKLFFNPDLTRVKIVSKDVEKEKNIRGFETDEIFK